MSPLVSHVFVHSSRIPMEKPMARCHVLLLTLVFAILERAITKYTNSNVTGCYSNLRNYSPCTFKSYAYPHARMEETTLQSALRIDILYMFPIITSFCVESRAYMFSSTCTNRNSQSIHCSLYL